jgi:hypothetical protein
VLLKGPAGEELLDSIPPGTSPDPPPQWSRSASSSLAHVCEEKPHCHLHRNRSKRRQRLATPCHRNNPERYGCRVPLSVTWARGGRTARQHSSRNLSRSSSSMVPIDRCEEKPHCHLHRNRSKRRQGLATPCHRNNPERYGLSLERDLGPRGKNC